MQKEMPYRDRLPLAKAKWLIRCFNFRVLRAPPNKLCNEPTPALFRSGCNGPEATIKSNSALSHILRRVSG